MHLDKILSRGPSNWVPPSVLRRPAVVMGAQVQGWRPWLLLGALLGSVFGCKSSTTERLQLPPLQTVRQVDLSRYLGSWYEIASFPQSFQEGCTGTQANYRLRDDGDIDVLNTCHQGSLEGEVESALGRAKVVDRSTNAKLEVSFFRPFWGDYWILELADDYSYSVVGHPSRDYLWILARTPTISEDLYQRLLAGLRDRGYETARLVRTVQPSGTSS